MPWLFNATRTFDPAAESHIDSCSSWIMDAVLFVKLNLSENVTLMLPLKRNSQILLIMFGHFITSDRSCIWSNLFPWRCLVDILGTIMFVGSWEHVLDNDRQMATSGVSSYPPCAVGGLWLLGNQRQNKYNSCPSGRMRYCVVAGWWT